MNNNSGASGLGLSSVLTIIFVVLKLVGVITWSWWWVLSPILIDIGLVIIAVIIYVIYITRHDNKYEFKLSKDEYDKWKF